MCTCFDIISSSVKLSAFISKKSLQVRWWHYDSTIVQHDNLLQSILLSRFTIAHAYCHHRITSYISVSMYQACAFCYVTFIFLIFENIRCDITVSIKWKKKKDILDMTTSEIICSFLKFVSYNLFLK